MRMALLWLTTWSPFAKTLWEGLGGVALLEEVCYWGLALKFPKPPGVPSVCLLSAYLKIRMLTLRWLGTMLCCSIMDSSSLKIKAKLNPNKHCIFQLWITICICVGRKKEAWLFLDAGIINTFSHIHFFLYLVLVFQIL